MRRLKPNPRCTKKRAQTLTEYALILAFISVAAIMVMQSLGTSVEETFEQIENKLDEAQSGNAAGDDDPTGGGNQNGGGNQAGGGNDPTGGGNAAGGSGDPTGAAGG